jgi:hypothetical protein
MACGCKKSSIVATGCGCAKSSTRASGRRVVLPATLRTVGANSFRGTTKSNAKARLVPFPGVFTPKRSAAARTPVRQPIVARNGLGPPTSVRSFPAAAATLTPDFPTDLRSAISWTNSTRDVSLEGLAERAMIAFGDAAKRALGLIGKRGVTQTVDLTADEIITAAVDLFTGAASDAGDTDWQRRGRTDAQVLDAIKSQVIARLNPLRPSRATFDAARLAVGGSGRTPRNGVQSSGPVLKRPGLSILCTAEQLADVERLNGMVYDLNRLANMRHSIDETGRGYGIYLAVAASPWHEYQVHCDNQCREGFAWYRSTLPNRVTFEPSFFELNGLVPDIVRASILVHELIHLGDAEFFCYEIFTQPGWETRPGWEDIGTGFCENVTDAFNISDFRDELRAALAQYDYLGLEPCVQDALANAYAERMGGGRDGEGRSAIAVYTNAIFDLYVNCLGWDRTTATLATVATVATSLALAAGLAGGRAILRELDAVLALQMIDVPWDCPP